MQAESGKYVRIRPIGARHEGYSRMMHAVHQFEIACKPLPGVGRFLACALLRALCRLPLASYAHRHVLQTEVGCQCRSIHVGGRLPPHQGRDLVGIVVRQFCKQFRGLRRIVGGKGLPVQGCHSGAVVFG